MPFYKSGVSDVLCFRCKNAKIRSYISYFRIINLERELCIADYCAAYGDMVDFGGDGRYWHWVLREQPYFRQMKYSAFSPTKEYEGLY